MTISPSDDTVVFQPPRRRRWVPLLLAGGGVGAVLAGLVAWVWLGRAPVPVPGTAPAPPAIAIETATEEAILAHRSDRPTLFRFAANPNILVLDVPTMHQQAAMLMRVAALVEVRDLPRDRVLDAPALTAAIAARGSDVDGFYSGHDYRGRDLARFFALADQAGQALSPDEGFVRAIVAQQGWAGAGAVGALISLPADLSADPEARRTILRHELSHGEYFTNPAYAAAARDFWERDLSAVERDGVRAFLAAQQYDSGIEDLMVNEAQAYIAHTRDPAFFRADLIGATPQRLSAMRAALRARMPDGWLRRATEP